MNLDQFPVWVSLAVIYITFFSVWCIKDWYASRRSRITLCTLIVLVWWYGFDLEFENTPLQGYTNTKVLVSTNPSESYTEGSFSLFMGTGSGEIETKRWYLLREEIREGLYKDFTVKNEVFIEERDDLPKGKGLFEQEYTCQLESSTYHMFAWSVESSEKNCYFSKQTIAVPKGFVIKEIRI